MNQPVPTIDALFAQSKPICFGRFIIEVPVSAQVVWGPTSVNDSIVSYPGQGHKVSEEINAKIRALKEDRHLREPSTYIGTFEGPNEDSKIVVGYASFEDSGMAQLHAYIRLGEHAFVQNVPTAVLGRDKETWVVNKLGYQKYVTEMQDIARRLRVREESEIPAEPGVCLEAGFIAEAEGRHYEMTSIGFRFPEYPDVSFSAWIHTTARPNNENSLGVALKGGRENAESMGMGKWYSRIKTLREGERRMGDWEGEEKLAWVPPQEDGKPWVHEFAFKSIGVANDMFRPYVNMRMSTGVARDARGELEPSLKDDEAVALWDRLTTSIRARPTDKRAAPSSPEKRSAIVPGTALASGKRCPQSGEWRCDPADAQGDSLRFFTAGDVFPPVSRPVPRTLWEKLGGWPDHRLFNTWWTLERVSENAALPLSGRGSDSGT